MNQNDIAEGIHGAETVYLVCINTVDEIVVCDRESSSQIFLPAGTAETKLLNAYT